jgi:NADH dehydrogenase
VERTDLHGRVLEIAGEEETTTNELLDRFAALTKRDPVRVSLPAFVVRAGAAIADAAGMDFPVNESQLTMLSEGNVIRTPGGNALTAVFRIKPTTLEEGLKKLADAQPEQTPDEGVGSIRRKRIWADISGSTMSPEALFEVFRRDFHEATPGIVDAKTEPGTRTDLEPGATITMSLPLRGNVQVRVQEVTPVKATLVTVAGHPLAGAVRFLSEQRGNKVRFEVQVYDRPASIADWFAMKTVGDAIQGRTWKNVVQRMIDASGGVAGDGIEEQDESLDEAQTELIEHWIKDLVMERLRTEAAS